VIGAMMRSTISRAAFAALGIVERPTGGDAHDNKPA
jgi:hypothetical protein